MTPQIYNFNKWIIEWKEIIDFHYFTLSKSEYKDKVGRNRTSYTFQGEDANGYIFLSTPTLPTEFKQWICKNINGVIDGYNGELYFQILSLYKTWKTFLKAIERNDKIDNLLK
ncbi:hypothetical protein [Hymenobacter lapidiphilus]|uniref:hypothetical protein n=1 Tax=Hymenobacter sp. CCM 8763 TaxID=2303334 RepID=UPI0011C10357|nr:hypothetical protein [Hymenobacter sp. CCM 8763]